MSIFTASELAYLAKQKLGRLATQAPDGTLQNNPVGYFVNAAGGYLDIGGHGMGASRKFRNVQLAAQVSLVVDDLSTEHGWQVRGIEFRGRAEALTDVDPPMPGFSREIIRIHPTRILTWGLPNSTTRNLP
ncbi:PPOX class F420-dependent oxidoreductase [Kribbella monticola]|uniref:PPOX class F420-dependent oxidoreductase n=1 Tax=Kribbella monticola TaxID=2185285 RepID=UPI000DD4621A|nr:PPOX class F420-dependent oxidoreductase [Kribbella monticola]